jgi:hypothetical protein
MSSQYTTGSDTIKTYDEFSGNRSTGAGTTDDYTTKSPAVSASHTSKVKSAESRWMEKLEDPDYDDNSPPCSLYKYRGIYKKAEKRMLAELNIFSTPEATRSVKCSIMSDFLSTLFSNNKAPCCETLNVEHPIDPDILSKNMSLLKAWFEYKFELYEKNNNNEDGLSPDVWKKKILLWPQEK